MALYFERSPGGLLNAVIEKDGCGQLTNLFAVEFSVRQRIKKTLDLGNILNPTFNFRETFAFVLYVLSISDQSTDLIRIQYSYSATLLASYSSSLLATYCIFGQSCVAITVSTHCNHCLVDEPAVDEVRTVLYCTSANESFKITENLHTGIGTQEVLASYVYNRAPK